MIGETAETFEREADERAQGVADKGAEVARGAGLDAHGAIRVDTSAWRAIAATALELSASAVVCGSRGNGAMSRAVLGSTSTSLLHHAGCPLLVVPAGPGPLDGPALIGYDGTDGAKAVLPVAAALLGDRAAVITHVWTSPLESFGGASLEVTPTTFGETALELEQQVRLMADDVALEGAELARAAGMPARPLTVQAHGGAWRSLLEAAGEQDAAVLVTGNRGRGAMKSSVLGSVSAGLGPQRGAAGARSSAASGRAPRAGRGTAAAASAPGRPARPAGSAARDGSRRGRAGPSACRSAGASARTPRPAGRRRAPRR